MISVIKYYYYYYDERHFMGERGISNLVTPSLTVAELFQKEIYERKKETMRERAVRNTV